MCIGSSSGCVSAGSISGMSVTSNSGSITAAGAGTITNITITTDSGTLKAVPDTTSGSGALTFVTIGSLTSTGRVLGATGSNFSATTVAGTINLTNTLSNLSAGTIAASASLSAGHFNIVTATQAVAGVNLVEPTVTRTLQLTAAPSSSLPQTFGFYYDGSGAGDPVVTVQVNAGSASNVRFDLSLLTSTEGGNGSGIDLGGVYAVGKGGFRNIVVAGDVRPGSANPGFFGLPVGTPGGVDLPLDTVAVAVAGSLPAGSIVAAGVPALAFNSAAGVSFNVATNTDALAPLAAGTALVQATDTYQVFTGAGKPVVQFLVTGPGGSFDSKALYFTDQLADNHPISAAVTLAPSGSSTAVQQVSFTGNYASLTTSQPITTAITDLAGALGDLILKAPQGITANVTAASIVGNIEAVNGAISGTIQTTVGDFGRAFTDATGTILGVTHVSTGGGGITSTGKLVSAANLVSQIDVQSGMDGLIAAQGDIGTIQRDANGNAVTDTTPALALTRFGGIVVSNGGLNGQVVALGNIFGDITLTGGLSGRIAAHGQPVAGLAAFRIGILGNVSISGGIAPTGAIVSRGLIGDDGHNNTSDDTLGTHLTISGNDKGILAAEEDINFGTTGSLNQSGLFENASGGNAQAIDAIFTDGGVLLTIADVLSSNSKILADLANLAIVIVNGQATLGGTTP
jgi:hypothetical protein